MSKINLANYSLADVGRFYRQGRVSRDQVVEYLRSWNSGPHLTQAVLKDSRIVNFYPEEGQIYKHLFEEFGIKA